MDNPVLPIQQIQKTQVISSNKIQNNEGYHQLHIYPDTRSQQYSVTTPLNELSNFTETFMIPVSNKTYLLDSCYLQIQAVLTLKEVTTGVSEDKTAAFIKIGDFSVNIPYTDHPTLEGVNFYLENQIWYVERHDAIVTQGSVQIPFKVAISTGPKNAMAFLDRSRIQFQNQTPKEDIYIYRYQSMQIMNLDENQLNNKETWFTGNQKVIEFSPDNNSNPTISKMKQYVYFKIPLRYLNTLLDTQNNDMLYTQYINDPIQLTLWMHSQLDKIISKRGIFDTTQSGITNLELQMYYTENQDYSMAVQQQQQLTGVIPRYDREELYQDSARQTDINLPSSLTRQLCDLFVGIAQKDESKDDSTWLHQIYGQKSADFIVNYINNLQWKNCGVGFYQFIIDIGSGNQLQDKAGYEKLLHFDADVKRFMNVDKLSIHRQLYDNDQYYNLMLNCFVYHSFRLVSLRQHGIVGDFNQQDLDVHLITQLGRYASTIGTPQVYTPTNNAKWKLSEVSDDTNKNLILECYGIKNSYYVYSGNGLQIFDNPSFLQAQQ